jgi:AraC-like DNA-binding protein
MKPFKSQYQRDLRENLKRGNLNFPLSAYIFEHEDYNNNVQLHWHSEVELVHFHKGEFKYTLNMQEYQVTDEAIAFIPANMLHSFVLPKNSHESAIVFDPKILCLNTQDESENELLECLYKGHCAIFTPITPEDLDFKELSSAFNAVISLLTTDPDAISKLKIRGKLLEIFAILKSKNFFTSSFNDNTTLLNREERVKKILDYLSSHYQQALTVESMSQKFGVSREYFCRFFKRHFKESFIDFLNDYRLTKAARDLILTTKNIENIALEYGYTNTGYFFRLFKKKYKVTPNAYRHLKK